MLSKFGFFSFFMKYTIYILIGFFLIFFSANDSFGQRKRDAFAGKSKKGPNIYSSKAPRTKSRSKLYGHSISKKKRKNKSKSVFSSSKSRYNSIHNKPKGNGDKGSKSSSGGRKSGKGRKKEK